MPRCTGGDPLTGAHRQYLRDGTPRSSRPAAAAAVKGCRTPARAGDDATVRTGLRAGVGQASREETAAHATVVVEGCVAMAIGAVRPW